VFTKPVGLGLDAECSGCGQTFWLVAHWLVVDNKDGGGAYRYCDHCAAKRRLEVGACQR